MPKKMCDFRCWLAAGKTCRCFCGGVNHGLGRENEDPVFQALMEDPELRKYGFTEEAYSRKKKELEAK